MTVVWTNGIVVSIGTEGIARAVNNSGVVVGETGGANLFLPSGKAFQYSNGTYTEIGDLGGLYSGAYDINDSGAVTGFSCTNYNFNCVGQLSGFRYQNGATEDLGNVSSPTGYSRGHGINEARQIVGRGSLVDFGNSEKHLAVWDENNAIQSIAGPYTYSTGQHRTAPDSRLTTTESLLAMGITLTVKCVALCGTRTDLSL